MTEELASLEETAQEEKDGGWSFTQIMIAAIGVFVGLILLVFLIGIGAAVAFDDSFGSVIRVIRDLVIIFIVLEGVLIGAAFMVFVAQLARLVNLLQTETRPIIENTQDAVSTVKGTADFVSNNATRPLIRFLSFFSGLRVFLRELGGIRRAIRRGGKNSSSGNSNNGRS